jgi:putative ABC transport system permease protein
MLKLAFLNLTRAVRRSLLSMGAIVAGVAVLIIGQGTVGGFDENTIRAQVDLMSGHVTVRPADYPTEGIAMPLDGAFVPSDWTNQLGDTWTTRTRIQAFATVGIDRMRVRIFAFDPERDAQVFPRTAWTIDGREPRTAEDGALVGSGVARLLDVGPGDTLTLEARTREGALNALDVPISGVVSVGSPLIDKFGVLVVDALGDSLVRTGDRVTHVHVRIADRYAAEPMAEGLSLPAGLETTTWVEQTAGILALGRIRAAALNLLVLALMAMSATGIANTVLMAAHERTREIGTLQAMGMTRSGVVRLFVTEGALLGVAGSVLGALVGGGFVAYFSANGFELPMAFAQSGNIPVSNLLYLQFSRGVILASALFGVFVAAAASVYPAIVASRMRPADAVRL